MTIYGNIPVLGSPESATGLSARDAERMKALMGVLRANATRNARLETYYAGRVPWDDVRNAVPTAYKGLDIGCDWGMIAVQSVAERSQLDGFTFTDPESEAARWMGAAFLRDGMALAYQRALVGMLVHGCVFGTVTKGSRGPRLRWHTARSASALWDRENERPECGMAIVSTRRDQNGHGSHASGIDLYVSEGVWELTYDELACGWSAEFLADPMGRPRMVSMAFRPDDGRPFGHSRFTHGMMSAMREYVANALNVHIASDLYAIGQKVLLGVDKKQYEKLVEDKWATAMDAALVLGKNVNGENPQAYQFQQQSMEPLLSVKRSLATDFAASASIPISELLTQDSNPTSAEALQASKDRLISLVEAMNRSNGEALVDAARMMQALGSEKGLGGLTDEQWGVGVRWRSPSTPSDAAVADFTIKVASAIEGYGQTSVAQERLGFDASERARLQGELRRVQARLGATAILDRNRRVSADADDGLRAGALQG